MLTARIETLTVKSSELRAGDVVLVHGMRVRIPEPRQARGIYTPPGASEPLPLYVARGAVENLEDVRADGFVPLSWMYDDQPQRRETEPHWTIQGNDNATWTVERTA